MAGMTAGRVPKFVKQYLDLRSLLGGAAKAFAEDVVGVPFRGKRIRFTKRPTFLAFPP